MWMNLIAVSLASTGDPSAHLWLPGHEPPCPPPPAPSPQGSPTMEQGRSSGGLLRLSPYARENDDSMKRERSLQKSIFLISTVRIGKDTWKFNGWWWLNALFPRQCVKIGELVKNLQWLLEKKNKYGKRKQLRKYK